MEWNKINCNEFGHVLSYWKLPKQKKHILCKIKSTVHGLPDCLVVGYLKYAAGCKDSPKFICTGHGGQVLAWCDCLPNDFTWPIA